MPRELTIGEQRRLAQILRSQNDMVYSFDLAPVDVNILPMQIVVDPAVVDRGVEGLRSVLSLSPVLARDIVLSVLGATADIRRGSTEHSESQTGGPTPGTASGSDNARTTDE
jgi:hypothetical protein